MAKKKKDDCECCDNLSPLAKETLNQIDLLIEGIQGAISVKSPGSNSNAANGSNGANGANATKGPSLGKAPGFKVSSPQSDQKDVLDTLTDLNSEMGGQISDIINLTKYFYSLNFATVKPSNLKVDDPNKKVGQFKLKDITDNPSIDITKFLDFGKIDISKFKKLKISLTVPTLVIEKCISLGPVTLCIKFMISLVEVTWMPSVSVDFDSIKKALANLKDSATIQKKLVGPADGKSLAQLKELAKKQFGKDPKNTDAKDPKSIGSLGTKDSNAAGGLGAKKSNVIVSTGTKYPKSLDTSDSVNSKALDNLGSNEPDILSNLLSLKSADAFFAVLNKNGINLVEEINVADVAAQLVATDEQGKKIADAKLLADVGIPIKDIDKLLKDLGAGKVTNADLGTMELCPVRVPAKPTAPKFNEDDIAAITQCAVDLKSQQIPELVDTPEIAELDDLLNNLPKDPGSVINDMNNFLSDLDKHNNEMQGCSKDKEDAKNKLNAYKQAYILHDFVHKYVAKRYSALKPDTLNKPYIALYKERDRLNSVLAQQVYERNTLLNQINTAVVNNSLDSKIYNVNVQINKTQGDLANLTSQFQSLKTDFFNGLVSDVAKLGFGTSGFDSDTLRTRIRTAASAELNPVSNLVGFDENKMSLVLYSDPTILAELKDIEKDAKSTGVTPEFFNYFRLSPYSFIPDPTNIASFNFLRKGAIEDVWRMYYSPNRIDLLFTWQEQGYTAPKPVYDDKGNVVGKTVKIEFTNGEGVKTIQEVPESVKNCDVNIDIAVPFLEKLEENTEIKIDKLINDALNSNATKAYVNKILSYAELEGKLKYLSFVGSLNFNESQNIFNTDISGEYGQSYKISEKIYDALSKKTNSTIKTIEECKTCIAKKKKDIAEAGAAFAKVAGIPEIKAKKKGLGGAGGAGAGGAGAGAGGAGADAGADAGDGNSDSIEAICKKKKGSDPFGMKQSSGDCPGATKNCYWKEYTKLLQAVSLMPIPDTQFLYRRLFRYYPVPLQIPVPIPIPTLALGIPDPLISIPLPFLWVHLISIQTPLGLFVIWLGMAGGFIPNPYVMLMDEKDQASFIFTPKGITPIPARQLMITPLEGKSLLDLFPAFETVLKLDLSKFGKLAAGSTRGTSTNPDDPKNVINEIKDKIKKSIDGLDIPDPFWSKENERAKPIKAKIKKAMEFTLPEADIPTTIKEAMDGVLDLANKAIDKMDIPPYKIPKNSKSMMTELPSFLEIKATVDKLTAAAKNGPADLVKKIYGDIGKSLSVFDVNKEIDKFIRNEMEKPAVKMKLIEANQKIDALEAKLSVSASFDDPESQAAIAAKAAAIKERTKAIKDVILIPVQGLADSITPEMIGFLGYLDSLPPLPFPCYTSIALPAVPPQVAAAIALIKSLPSIIKGIPDNIIANLLLGIIDLSKTLPSAEELFFMAIGPLLTKVPRLVIPTGFKQNLMKLIIKAVKDFILQFKIRLPKPGLPTQLIIPSAIIKTIMKEAVKIAFGILIGVIIQYVNDILKKLGPERVAAILALLAVVKLIFGTDLHKIKGADIKAFLNTVIKSAVYPALDSLNPIITAASAVKAGFKSIMEMFTLPDINVLLKKEGPFFELDTKGIKKFVDPLLYQVVPVVAAALPFPVILLIASTTPGRLVLTKIDPRKAIEKLPSWEGLSLKNIPLLLFLDQLAATAQRTAILNSDYLIPYFIPVTP